MKKKDADKVKLKINKEKEGINKINKWLIE